MAKKKGFAEVAQAQPVYSMIEQQELDEAREAMQTQGREGMKAMRINMAFTPSNIDFVRTMAAIRGVTMTQFVNDIIARERESMGEKYAAAMDALKNL